MLTSRIAAVLLSAGTVLACSTADVAQNASNSGPLWKTHQWFELRNAATEVSAPLTRGALAVAFNDPGRAERLLREVIRRAPASSDANDAYALLARVYQRTGQYARFATLYTAWALAFPRSEAALRERENFEKFRGRPDQINGPLRRSLFRRDTEGYLTLPVSINGRTDDFLFDTGAWQSAVTEAEARKLGLTIDREERILTDVSGTRVKFRTALANEIAVGQMRFRNVSLAVIEGGGVFKNIELGIIGMPMIVALGRVDWSGDGAVETGGVSHPSTPREPNLAFDHSRLVVQTAVLGRRALIALDTGANATSLNANFSDTFPDAAAMGRKSTDTLTGIGGAQTFDAIELPEVRFTIGSRQLLLRPAMISRQRVATAGGECCVGNMGHDLLRQAAGFTLDFSTMTLELR